MKEKILKITFALLLGTGIFFGDISKIFAATANISVKSSSNTIIVGKSFTVTVTVSSSVALGSWEYTIDYNSSLLKYESGTKHVADYGNGSKKSATYTYKFKAIGSGSPKIGVKSYGAFDWNEKKMSVTTSSKTIKTLTQSQLEDTYSKNNNLKSLSIKGSSLDPSFDKNTTSYTVKLDSNTENVEVSASPEDSSAEVDGTGTISVSEGDNKIEIIVTAENGSVKKYTIIATVSDPNPIVVKDINNNELTVVKRESLLKAPEPFTKTTATVNNITVPAFYNEITKFTLVGLKNKDGEINFYLYDSSNNTFELYEELLLNQIKIYPLDFETDKFEDYTKSKITINDVEVTSYKLKNSSDCAIIYGINVDTGEKDYYIYDSKTNSVIRYNSEETDILNNKLNKYYSIILGLGGESIFLVIIIIIIMSKSVSKKKKRLLGEKKKRNSVDKVQPAEIKESISIKEKKKKKKDKQ